MTLCEADITTKIQVNSKNTTTILKLFEENSEVEGPWSNTTDNRRRNHGNFQAFKRNRHAQRAIKEAILEGEIANEYQAAYDFMLKGLKDRIS
jgi:tRNA nucleotidyltransferase (CCA-adding enzyme)